MLVRIEGGPRDGEKIHVPHKHESMPLFLTRPGSLVVDEYRVEWLQRGLIAKYLGPRGYRGGKQMTVQEIVEKHLRDNGFDGLFSDEYLDEGQCHCLLDGLMPCGESLALCEAGYRIPCSSPSGDPTYYLTSKKPQPEPETPDTNRPA